jgi:Skp family chaperone for outer membrane proteins
MSLTTDDLNEIRNVIESALTRQSSEIIKPIQNELQALRSDIKEIYDMLAGLENKVTPETQFNKLSLEEKLLKLNSELLAAAKQAGISLPR